MSYKYTKREKILLGINIAIIILMVVVPLILRQKLPNSIPTHWNLAGEVDGYMPKLPGVFMPAIIATVMLLLFQGLPYLDPKKDNYEKFRGVRHSFQTLMIVFFAYIQAITLYSSFATVNVGKWIVVGVGVLLIILGNYLGKIRQNWFMGIKTPWTLSNEENWNKTHRLGGRLFVLSGLMLAVNALLGLSSMLLPLIALGISIFLPIIYSYLLFQKQPKAQK